MPTIFLSLQLVPLLASALEFGSAAAPALAALLKMGSWLSTEEFSAKVMLFQYLYNVLIFGC
jgi:SCY1-like protein 1